MYPIDLVFIAFLVYVPSLVILYLIVIWVIVKEKPLFRTSFYSLFVASAVSIYSGYRNDRGDICSFAFQDLLNCFIAFNRLTSVVRPFKHAQIWRRILPYTIAVSIIIPFCLFFLQSFRPVNYFRIPLGEYDVYFPDGSEHIFPWFDIHRISASTQVVTAIIEAILYCLTYRKLRRTVAAHQDRVILRFGVIRLLVCCPGIIMQTFAAFELSKSEPSPVFFFTYVLPIDVKFLSPLIIMLLVNSMLRREVFKIGRLKISISSNVATTSFPI